MDWNVIRNNTSFVTEATEYFRSVESSEVFRSHQNIVIKYFEHYPVRGMLLFHKMGMGKSLLGAAILNGLMNDHDAIFVSAKTLHGNFEETIRKFTELTGSQFNGQVQYVSLNASNMMTQIDKATLTPLERLLNKGEQHARGTLDRKVIIIDEAHNFFNSITNGSENATRLYRAIMKSKCRPIFLTGSPITNDPFEIALCFNMLTGMELFPESYGDFTSYFVNRPEGQIKNHAKFANRINGLVSYYDAEALTANAAMDFPRELPLRVIRCIMSPYQYGLYYQARKHEIDQQLRKTKTRDRPLQKTRAGNGSYRVMSRQLSNFAFPEYAIYREHGVDVHDEAKLRYEDIHHNMAIYGPKIKAIVDTALHNPGIQLIYSQYIKYGLGIMARYLDEMTKYGDFDGKYALITGEVDKIEVARLLDIINSEANMRGAIYKIVLISGAASEGVDFKNVRGVHIMEPYWHWSRILQVIGRGVRLGSHRMLPEGERDVQPYIYIASHGIAGNNEETTDEYLMNKSIRNQKLINSFYLILRMSAIDCTMHYKECRTCLPTNRPLFTEDIMIDLSEGDPCSTQRMKQARLFEYEGETYAEFMEDGEIYFAHLNSEGKYERVPNEIRLILLGVTKKYKD